MLNFNPKKREARSRNRVLDSYSNIYSKGHPGDSKHKQGTQKDEQGAEKDEQGAEKHEQDSDDDDDIHPLSKKMKSFQTLRSEAIHKDSDRVFYHLEFGDDKFISNDQKAVGS
jgi:hypothetical protein